MQVIFPFNFQVTDSRHLIDMIRSFHTSDGQKREETGILINGGQELLVRGSYSYTGTDNKVYMVEYVADRNGFHPKVTILEGEEEEIPAITLAGYDPDSNIRPHALKSLLGK